jgi:hypothetical protein
MENASSPKRTVMITMHVPQTLAILQLEIVSTEQLPAKMVTDVLKIDVTLQRDVFTKKSTVTTATHVPLTLATHLLDVSTLQSNVTTTMHVPRIGVILRPEKLNMKESYVMTRTHVPSNLAILSLDVSSNQSTWTRRTTKIPTNV